jgi:hypothetical protein
MQTTPNSDHNRLLRICGRDLGFRSSADVREDEFTVRCSRTGFDFRTIGMLQKTIYRISTLALFAAFAVVTGCTTPTPKSDSTSTSNPTGGSNANPQTGLKKQTG